MAREITENQDYEQSERKSSNSNVLYREHLEYTAKKMFWASILGLGAVTIYASLTYLVVKQLRKD
ncbi:MAG: hypothetical protein GBAus27B_000223 [Mycoplasmataceae bacterium]|nr:MAG: hypothetical protein GBAus27B_000223 [Mycoplasmataceae bacterium]